MSYLKDLYGNNYKNDAIHAKVDQYTNLIASNISNLEFRCKFPDSFRDIPNFYDKDKMKLLVATYNKNLKCHLLDINTSDVSIIPYIVVTKEVDYYLLIDEYNKKSYIFYISYDEMAQL